VLEVAATGAGIQVARDGRILDDDPIELRAGDVITAPANGNAAIVYASEATRIEIFPGGILVFEGAAQGKRFELRRGVIHAQVAPQPADQPMSVKTAQARATVVGTAFVMRVDDRGTKLDVLEGKVKLACRVTGKKVVVSAGCTATSCPKTPFNVTPLCNSNCILRECRSTNASSSKSTSTNEK
jgi:ferric-dicitrate binding protein FerR (iron transport regulator)